MRYLVDQLRGSIALVAPTHTHDVGVEAGPEPSPVGPVHLERLHVVRPHAHRSQIAVLQRRPDGVRADVVRRSMPPAGRAA